MARQLDGREYLSAYRLYRFSFSMLSFFAPYVYHVDGERERERMHNADLCSVVVHRGERIISSRQVRNPRVFTALSSLLYDAYHATIEQMRCGYVLVVTRWRRFKEHSRVEFFKIF